MSGVSDKWLAAVKQAFTETYDAMNMDIADDKCRRCDYAFDHCDLDGQNPVNWADAGAFYLSGYIQALRDLKANTRKIMFGENADPAK